ncbi:serine/threonine-protein kinase PBL27-like [Triticum urartu]|nr:serine/threonine-protein kinase PBL27-like [Triticum urartu]
MNIAAGVAKGLEYLHDKGVVYHIFMSSSDVLLGEGHHPKLSQYGLADLGRLVVDDDEKLCIDFTRTAAIAPETGFKGKATMESNVYNFGGVLLELITGRRPVDPTRAIAEDCNLVIWATRLMDRGQFRRMADPALQGHGFARGTESCFHVHPRRAGHEIPHRCRRRSSVSPCRLRRSST